MTDITELAQREKFEAWWERTQHNGNPPRFCWSYWRDGEGYKVDDDDAELDGMWSAWKAAGAELVEALEKAQETIAFQQREIKELLSSLESRTVKMPEPFKLAKSSSGLTYYFADDVDAALAAAGIKWEAE